MSSKTYCLNILLLGLIVIVQSFNFYQSKNKSQSSDTKDTTPIVIVNTIVLNKYPEKTGIEILPDGTTGFRIFYIQNGTKYCYDFPIHFPKKINKPMIATINKTKENVISNFTKSEENKNNIAVTQEKTQEYRDIHNVNHKNSQDQSHFSNNNKESNSIENKNNNENNYKIIPALYSNSTTTALSNPTEIKKLEDSSSMNAPSNINHSTNQIQISKVSQPTNSVNPPSNSKPTDNQKTAIVSTAPVASAQVASNNYQVMVNNQGQLIDKQGKFVNIKGQLVEKPVQYIYKNKDKQLINPEGKFINQYGQLVSQPVVILDPVEPARKKSGWFRKR